jgi:microcin C transport system substrate-binding protein
VFSRELFSLQFETLLGQDPLTLEATPGLAESVVVSDDKLVFTIVLDPRARWSDGRPITADDVVWTWNATLKDENLTGPHKVGLDKFGPPEKVDERTVRATATMVHWKNLWSIAGLRVLPKHWWETQDFNKVNFEFPVTSGPYRIKTLSEPHSVLLERRADYWAKDDPRGQHLSNFDEIEYRFYGENDVAWDNFLRGEFDLFAVYTASRWATQTSGERFDMNWIVKQAVHNKDPIGFQGFAMNLRRPLFQDRRVRRALAHLLDRPRMNASLMFNQYFLQRSYWEDLYDAENPNTNDEIAFDVDKARALLAEAGWKVDGNGVLAKDGVPFVLNFLTRAADSDKFLLIYREDLRKVGIDLKIERKDWSAWAKDMDEYNFDMTWAAWGAGTFKDPESMWHSRYADQASGQNITGYKNPEVDAMIDAIRGEFDMWKRHETVRRIDKILTDETPYILLWNLNYARILSWNKFGMPDHVLGKYGDEWNAAAYWWIDPDMEADLAEAQKAKRKLPGRPFEVHFDKVFHVPAATEALR